MNKIIITGRLTRDPELRACNSGMEVCNLSVAVDRRVKKGDEKKADFIDCTAWGKTGVFVNQYFRKGDGITIEGRMESRKWVDKDGNNRIAWNVVCDNVEFPLGKAGGNSNNTYKGGVAEPVQDFSEIVDDGELPF